MSNSVKIICKADKQFIESQKLYFALKKALSNDIYNQTHFIGRCKRNW